MKPFVLLFFLAITAFSQIGPPSGAPPLIGQRGTLANIPTACQLGQLYFASDQTAGSNVYGCTTAGNPGAWTLEGGGGSGYLTHELDLSASQIKSDLNASPLVLVPAQGVKTIIHLVQVSAYYTFVTHDYSQSGVQYDATSTFAGWPSGFEEDLTSQISDAFITSFNFGASGYHYPQLNCCNVRGVSARFINSAVYFGWAIGGNLFTGGTPSTVTIGAGGTMYAMGDTGQILCAGTTTLYATYTVTSVAAITGAVTGVSLSAAPSAGGNGCIVANGVATQTLTGSGDGNLTLNVTAITGVGDGTIKIITSFWVETTP